MTDKAGLSAARNVLLASAILALTLSSYLPAIHGGFIWDDDDYVTQNAALRDLQGLGQIWSRPGSVAQYYPLTYTTFWVDYHLWGLRPLPYHVENVVLHAISAIILWRLLAGLAVPGAWLAAALFALHPVQVESVAWITERKNVLAGVFYVGAGYAYLSGAGLLGGDRTGAARPAWSAVSLLLFLCALLSKTVTCSLPAVLLLIIWWKREGDVRRHARALAPFFVVGMVSAAMTVWMERYNVQAVGKEWGLSPPARCLLAGRALCFYAGKLFWPSRLAFIYPRWQINTSDWQQYLYPIAAVAVMVALWLARRRIGKGPLVAALCFAGALFPALGFFNTYPMRYSYVADHFQYLASIFLIVPAAAVVSLAAERLFAQAKEFKAFLPGMLLAICWMLTWRQGYVYTDLTTLWTDTLRKNPDCWLAHNNLGNEFDRAGNYAKAWEHYREAQRVEPDFPETPLNVGLLLIKEGRPGEAIGYFQRTLELRPRDVRGHYNMGVALVQSGRIAEGISHLRTALEIDPGSADTHHSLGAGLMLQGELPEATQHLQEAVRLNPRFHQAQANLGQALLRQGDIAQAIVHLKTALELQPDFAMAHRYLAEALAADGETDEAVRHYRQALHLNPGQSEIRFGLAKALADAGRLEDAVGEYERILRTRPNNAAAHFGLGEVLQRQGKLQEAAESYRRALQSRPDMREAREKLESIGSE